jgi:hypothetical protein
LKQYYLDSFTMLIASLANIVLGLPLSSGRPLFVDKFGVQAEDGCPPALRDLSARVGFQPDPLFGPAQ